MPDDRVDLTDLDVITRYSLAVRAATADRAELIAALRSDLDWLEGGRRPTTRRTPAKAPAKSATKKTATTKRTAAKKTARKTAR